MSIEIRAPGVGDADGLERVHVRAWQAVYSGGLMPGDYLSSLSSDDRSAMWRSGLQTPPRSRSSRLIATVDDVVAGFALVGPSAIDENTDVGELYAINVDPDHWGAGVGGALMDEALVALSANGFDSAVLWVDPGNE